MLHGFPKVIDDDAALRKATLKVYKGAPHGMGTTHQQQVHEDLLQFIRS